MAIFALNDGTGSIWSSYPYTELWDLLVEKTAEVGHVLTFDEAHRDPKFIDPNCYATSLGGRFSEWAKKAWYAVEARQEDGMKRSISKEQVTTALKKFYDAKGRLPTQKELNTEPDLPGYDSVHRILGPKSTWLKQLSEEESPPEAEQRLEAESHPDTEQHPEAEPQVEIKTSSEDNDSPPRTEVIVVSPSSQVTQGTSNVAIELKISLPDRETPIIINLSF